jgi:hypothetical protein
MRMNLASKVLGRFGQLAMEPVNLIDGVERIDRIRQQSERCGLFLG